MDSANREPSVLSSPVLGRLVRWLYNILFSLVFWGTSPWLLLKLRRRGPWREAFGQRFGRYEPDSLPAAVAGGRRLWLHAVSVGEVNTCLQFVRCLQACLTNVQIIVSTTTNTGMAELRKKLPANVTPIYFPVDLRRYVRRALDRVRPDAVILVEREIWPNFLWQLHERSIPLFLINARISERSHRSYQRYGFLFRTLYAQFALVSAQTDADAQRLRDVGCRDEVLHVLGSMKFDAPATQPAIGLDVPDLLGRAGRKPGAPVLVAGSTHDGEELLLARVAQHLRVRFPDLFLVLVPRHFERCSDVSKQLTEAGLSHVLRSTFNPAKSVRPEAAQTLLVDSTGELTAFYAEADVVFIGKSLCARGGQNPIEPAALGKAIVAGPHMQNFPGVTQQLREGNAIVQVADQAELEFVLTSLLGSAQQRAELGRHARRVVDRNAGATQRTAELLVETLSTLRGSGHAGKRTGND